MARDMSEAAPEAVGLSAAGLAAIDAALQGEVDSGALAGVVTLVARRGQVAHVRAMGMADLASGEPLKTDSIFRVYSMTKPVTGAAMMILHDEGRWAPDDPIARHLPAFAGVKVLAGTAADGSPVPTEPEHAPTMRELMTQEKRHDWHRSFADEFKAGNITRSYRQNRAIHGSRFSQRLLRLLSTPQRWCWNHVGG
jgi:CubicO group peptidase (beta-lactamase class C family)